MVCPEDCLFLFKATCNLTALASPTEEDCESAADCINAITYVALSLVGTLTLQVMVLTTCLLCCCMRKRTCKKVHKEPSSGTEDIELKGSRLTVLHKDQQPLPDPPNEDASGDKRIEMGTADGLYDTLASSPITNMPPIHSLDKGQPMHYQPNYSANGQMESQYDVISSLQDAHVGQDDKSCPVFTVEGCYAEISKSEEQEKSKTINVPVTVVTTCEVSPSHEYAVVKKPKRRKSIDNLSVPSDATNAPPLPPQNLPDIIVSQEQESKQCKDLPGKDKQSVDQCKDMSSENPGLMPTCNVLPLWPNETPTMAVTSHTEDETSLNSIQSHPTQPLSTGDPLGSCQTADMEDIPKLEC